MVGECKSNNNALEWKGKKSVIGRKNWPFFSGEDDAKITCKLYLILRTAIDNNLNLKKYLNYLIDTSGNDWNIKYFIDFVPRSNQIQILFKILSSNI